VLDQAHRFNAENTRKFDVRRMALAGEQLGAIEAERLHSDQDLALL
jgi:hypothetical protein